MNWLFLYLSILLIVCPFPSLATHGQTWTIFGRKYAIESIWTEEQLNDEMGTEVFLIRSDIIKRNGGIRIKLVADQDTILGRWKYPSEPIKAVLSVFDRNQDVFVDQRERQLLPSVVGESTLIRMSEFWGAQNYGPVLFYFHDGRKGAEIESKMLIVISGGKQKTRDKMKERLNAGLSWIRNLQDVELENKEDYSDLSPISDSSSLGQKNEKEDKPEMKVEIKEEEGQFTKSDYSSSEFDRMNEGIDWDNDPFICPAQPIKFMDLLQQDWFTPLEPSDSTITTRHNHNNRKRQTSDPINNDNENSNGINNHRQFGQTHKKMKTENTPEVQESANNEENPSVEEANQQIKDEENFLPYEIDDDFLRELESEWEGQQKRELKL